MKPEGNYYSVLLVPLDKVLLEESHHQQEIKDQQPDDERFSTTDAAVFHPDNVCSGDEYYNDHDQALSYSSSASLTRNKISCKHFYDTNRYNNNDPNIKDTNNDNNDDEDNQNNNRMTTRDSNIICKRGRRRRRTDGKRYTTTLTNLTAMRNATLMMMALLIVLVVSCFLIGTTSAEEERNHPRDLSIGAAKKGTLAGRGRGVGRGRDPSKIPKGCKIGPSGHPPSNAGPKGSRARIVVRGETQARQGGRPKGAAIRSRESQLDLGDFDFMGCFQTPDESVGDSLQQKAVVDIQFMSDRASIPFALEPDPNNPGALRGKRVLDDITDSNSNEPGMAGDERPFARQEIGEINIVFDEHGAMVGSAQVNHTLYHFLPMEDGTMNIMEISIGELPPDEDEFGLDLVKEDNTKPKYGEENNRQLLRGTPSALITMEDEFKRMLQSNGDQGYYYPMYPSKESDENTIASAFDEDFYRMGNTSEEFIVDVMVPYTQRTLCAITQAQSGARCVPNERRKQLVEARVKLAIQEANVAYENSGIVGRLRLVHTFMIPTSDYDEHLYDKYSEILRHIAYPDDGTIDYVHQLREQYGADVVVFMIDNSASCGLAYTGNPVSATWAYSVVNWICATGYYSFVHEISHHMGGRHDRKGENCSTTPDQCCALTGECDRYAWQDPEDRFRSIMAYNCNVPGGCPRVQYFSQPALKFPLQSTAGDVLEVPIGDNYNNNARSISGDIRQVARYREHVEHVPVDPSGPAPEVCGNGICEPSVGEDCDSCPDDCISGTFQKEECGNGICEATEDCLNCPEDCAFRLDIPPTKDPYKYCCVGGPKNWALNYIEENEIAFGVPCTQHSQCLFQTKCSVEPPSERVDYCCGDGTCQLGEGTWSCESDCPCIDDGVCDLTREDFSCSDCHVTEFLAEQTQEVPIDPNTGGDKLEKILEEKCMVNGRVCHGISPDPCCGMCHPKSSRCVGGADTEPMTPEES